jgi:phospholipid/cholesterol/gamma-HCH transport system permease protein
LTLRIDRSFMPLSLVEKIGRDTNNAFAAFGDFWAFVGQTLRWLVHSGWRPRTLRQLLPLTYEVGVRSVPVVALTGAFIGMVMAIETISQFRVFGREELIGSVIGLTVVKQIGPVLAAVMLAGRVGGALTAELGTMNVTEQLDALRVMGSDPIRYLVVPRVIVCVLLTPMLTIYSDLLGVLGGFVVSTQFLGVPADPYWASSADGVDTWQIMEGLAKSVLFGAAIALISCYKGFTCGPGASGVGKACTDSFVTSFLAIIVINFFCAKLFQDLYSALFGSAGLFD